VWSGVKTRKTCHDGIRAAAIQTKLQMDLIRLQLWTAETKAGVMGPWARPQWNVELLAKKCRDEVFFSSSVEHIRLAISIKYSM
jgi:hypothetical protein